MSPNTIVAGVGGPVTVTGDWFFRGSTRVQVTGMKTEPAVTVVRCPFTGRLHPPPAGQ